MYYIYSFVISLILYFVLDTFYKSQKKLDKDPKDENILQKCFTFIIIYVIITAIIYFLFNQSISFDKPIDQNYDIGKNIKSNVDTNLLKKIPEEVDFGFSINDISDSE